MGATSIRRLHATLMSALNSAVKRRLLPAHPAAHVELPSARRVKAVVWTAERIAVWQRTGVRPVVAVWTPQQTGVFLDAAAEHRLYALFRLIAYRGLRRDEAVGLRWEDVDLQGRSLNITQQVVQIGWELDRRAQDWNRRTDGVTRRRQRNGTGRLACDPGRGTADVEGGVAAHGPGVHPKGRHRPAPRDGDGHLPVDL
jgi:integrase